MSSTGAFRLPAAFVSAAYLALVFCALPCPAADDCSGAASVSNRIVAFKQLDQQAEAAMHARKFSEAASLYQNAVCLVPDSARGWYGLAMAQAAANDFSRARTSYATADRLQPASPIPLVMQVKMNLSLHDTDQVKANLRALSERFPNDAAAHRNVARNLAEASVFDLALAEALRAGQATPGDPSSLVEIAGLENTVGAYADAAANALSVEADASASSELRAVAAGIAGLSYESLAQSDLAVQYLKKSIELDPHRENSYLALADLYDQLQRHAEAAALLRQANQLVPGSTAIYLALGTALVRSEQYADGIAVLRTVIQHQPDAEAAYVSLADAARKTGDTSAELQALRGLEKYNPAYPMLSILIARALLNTASANTNAAAILSELAKAEQQSPSDPEVHLLRARVFTDQNDLQKAISELQRAIALNPLDAAPYYQLGRLYLKTNQRDLADAAFARHRYLRGNTP